MGRLERVSLFRAMVTGVKKSCRAPQWRAVRHTGGAARAVTAAPTDNRPRSGLPHADPSRR
jgi:hypothetical protein